MRGPEWSGETWSSISEIVTGCEMIDFEVM